MFQQSGASAYHPGLETIQILDSHFGHPHRAYRTIHVGGTNGKGSTSHTLGAILQSAGYRVGLYTSPHLIDFRERIRVNGEMMEKEAVRMFVEASQPLVEQLHPSFFELSTMMAFCYFRQKEVDIALIEVGLGGRLDSTNIITPIISIITNISKDHTMFLGDTVAEIATEKAGIIKSGIPAVVGNAEGEGVREVFEARAQSENAPLNFAAESGLLCRADNSDGRYHYETKEWGSLDGELGGLAQEENTATILTALHLLHQKGDIKVSAKAVRDGFAHVTSLTGLQGRWQMVSERPRIICDTGHNIGGMQHIVKQLNSYDCKCLHMVFGMVNDKDISSVLAILPSQASYYFTQASVERALTAEEMKQKASAYGLEGKAYATVKDALEAACALADVAEDLIFVGGSTFVVADLLRIIQNQPNTNN